MNKKLVFSQWVVFGQWKWVSVIFYIVFWMRSLFSRDFWVLHLLQSSGATTANKTKPWRNSYTTICCGWFIWKGLSTNICPTLLLCSRPGTYAFIAFPFKVFVSFFHIYWWYMVGFHVSSTARSDNTESVEYDLDNDDDDWLELLNTEEHILSPERYANWFVSLRSICKNGDRVTFPRV
mgnify:FL=1